MKIGICCVYSYGPDSEWLLDLQLRHIEHMLTGYDYTIYAAANRLLPELRRRLELAPRLRVTALPLYPGDGSQEHAHYMDLLLRHAADDGCTHLATLDSDSFPVLPDWPRILLERMNGRRLAAVLRAENLDTFLPHPCGLFMHRSFLLDRAPRMLPPRDEIRSSESFQRFLRTHQQRPDTGIGYGYVLWTTGEPWLALLRSNRSDLHFLMAGIYGDVFFHLGASSRTLRFYRDTQTRLSRRIGATLSGLPALWRAGHWLDERYIRLNQRTFAAIVAALRTDPGGFLSSLSQGQHRQGPLRRDRTQNDTPP